MSVIEVVCDCGWRVESNSTAVVTAAARAHDETCPELFEPDRPQDAREGGSDATAGPLGPPEPPPTERLTGAPESPDPGMAHLKRRARYRDAIAEVVERTWVWSNDIADVVMALADAELADLKAVLDTNRASIRLLLAELSATRAEVHRLRTEATWDRLAAETGAERAQTEVANLKAEADRYAQSWNEAEDDLNEARELLRQADLRADGLRARINEMDREIEGNHECALLDPAPWDSTPCDCRECRLQRERDEARVTIENVTMLAETWEQVGSSYISVPEAAARLREVLDEMPLPTEPGPDLDPGTAEGSGLWLSTPLEDPPPVDPLTATRDRLDAAMRQQEPTT